MTNTIDPISYNAGIEACRFCGSADAHVFECEDETAGASIFWVECESCSARGPTSEYKDGALIHWSARTEPQTAPSADRETLQTLLDLLNPLHGSLDRQMYVDKPNPDFDPHPDDETDVIVTAKMERDLTQAVRIIESRLKDGVTHESPSAAPADAERLALADEIDAIYQECLKNSRPTTSFDDAAMAKFDWAIRKAWPSIVSSLRAGGWREDMQS